MLVFPDPNKQIQWAVFGKTALPRSFFFAVGNGAAVVAKHGNKPAAVAGARAIRGEVLHGS